MRTIELTKHEFDETFFGVVTNGNSPAKDENEHEIALRLLRQLKDTTLTYPEDPKPDVVAQVEASGQRWWPSYRLHADSVSLELEEDVYRVVRHRFKDYIPLVHPLMAEEFDVVWQKIKTAESWDANKQNEGEHATPEPLEATG